MVKGKEVNGPKETAAEWSIVNCNVHAVESESTRVNDKDLSNNFREWITSTPYPGKEKAFRFNVSDTISPIDEVPGEHGRESAPPEGQDSQSSLRVLKSRAPSDNDEFDRLLSAKQSRNSMGFPLGIRPLGASNNQANTTRQYAGGMFKVPMRKACEDDYDAVASDSWVTVKNTTLSADSPPDVECNSLVKTASEDLVKVNIPKEYPNPIVVLSTLTESVITKRMNDAKNINIAQKSFEDMQEDQRAKQMCSKQSSNTRNSVNKAAKDDPKVDVHKNDVGEENRGLHLFDSPLCDEESSDTLKENNAPFDGKSLVNVPVVHELTLKYHQMPSESVKETGFVAKEGKNREPHVQNGKTGLLGDGKVKDDISNEGKTGVEDTDFKNITSSTKKGEACSVMDESTNVKCTSSRKNLGKGQVLSDDSDQEGSHHRNVMLLSRDPKDVPNESNCDSDNGSENFSVDGYQSLEMISSSEEQEVTPASQRQTKKKLRPSETPKAKTQALNNTSPSPVKRPKFHRKRKCLVILDDSDDDSCNEIKKFNGLKISTSDNISSCSDSSLKFANKSLNLTSRHLRKRDMTSTNEIEKLSSTSKILTKSKTTLMKGPKSSAETVQNAGLKKREKNLQNFINKEFEINKPAKKKTKIEQHVVLVNAENKPNTKDMKQAKQNAKPPENIQVSKISTAVREIQRSEISCEYVHNAASSNDEMHNKPEPPTKKSKEKNPKQATNNIDLSTKYSRKNHSKPTSRKDKVVGTVNTQEGNLEQFSTRRSERHRVPPTLFWLGQRVEYKEEGGVRHFTKVSGLASTANINELQSPMTNKSTKHLSKPKAEYEDSSNLNKEVKASQSRNSEQQHPKKKSVAKDVNIHFKKQNSELKSNGRNHVIVKQKRSIDSTFKPLRVSVQNKMLLDSDYDTETHEGSVGKSSSFEEVLVSVPEDIVMKNFRSLPHAQDAIQRAVCVHNSIMKGELFELPVGSSTGKLFAKSSNKVFIIMEGTVSYKSCLREIQLSAGSFFIICQGEFYTIINVGDSKVRLAVVSSKTQA